MIEDDDLKVEALKVFTWIFEFFFPNTLINKNIVHCRNFQISPTGIIS